MSDPNSAQAAKAGSPKKPVSPARNVIGVVVLGAALVVLGFVLYARAGYNAAVNALKERTQQEEKELASVEEAEKLIGKPADGPGADASDGNFTYTKKTYTWNGLLKSFTLTAYYTKTKAGSPSLHHYETDGEKYTPEVNAAPPPPPGGSAPTRGKMAKSAPKDEAPKAADAAPAPATAPTTDAPKPAVSDPAPATTPTTDAPKPAETPKPVDAAPPDAKKPN
jgi:hypothetical protein